MGLNFVFFFIAAGLYYLAELVEEFTVMSGKIIKYMVIVCVLYCKCSLTFYTVKKITLISTMSGF